MVVPGLSVLLQSAKTKLIVLSSLLGVGSIIYFTKNYIQYGSFLGSNQTCKTKILGGKQMGVQQNIIIPSKLVLRKRRQSYVSNRKSSVSTIKRHSSLPGSSSEKNYAKIDVDKELDEAVKNLNKSMNELEEVLGLPNNNNCKYCIDNEIIRLRNLIDLGQNPQQVITMAENHLANNKNEVYEELIQDVLSTDLNTESYNCLVDEIRKIKDIENDYDSDNDSFISASESVDLQISDSENYEAILTFEKKLKELIKKHSFNDLYMYGIEYLTHYGIPVRSIRAELLNCENDVDFCVKVYCLRRAFKDLLTNSDCRCWFISSGKEVMVSLLKQANHDYNCFSENYDSMLDYCSDSNNWECIEEELSSRGVCTLNFYDVVLDFMIMDSLVDLENPPYSVTTAIQNKWLSTRFKETALSTAIWAVIKSKKSMLKNANGFYAKFYDISMHITPVLAWGLLGPVKELNQLCSSFKDTMLGFLRDIFNVEIVSYKSVESLSKDIFRIAKQRKEELIFKL
ncbi:mitoguardin isoform X1 [Hydra vulgaris]|uniref:mitoguardin isoform X1 n=1 Tax=Hydra vulgaris TaxID=6087 RepID=UPI0006415D66|nr:mitoguardin isoform X1 [Hydra vulgaris]